MLTTSDLSKVAITMSEDFSPGLTAAVVVEDRRSCVRVVRRMGAKIVGKGFAEAPCCATGDISEGGTYICVPTEVGLRVGQRCELALFEGENQAPDSSPIEPVYATVVRTHVVKQGAQQFIGAGFRFDQPLYL